jgi:hypothetical protein
MSKDAEIAYGPPMIAPFKIATGNFDKTAFRYGSGGDNFFDPLGFHQAV